MADNYIRKSSTATYIPGEEGTPSYPGQPYVAPYCIWVETESVVTKLVCMDGDGNTSISSGTGVLGLNDPDYNDGYSLGQLDGSEAITTTTNICWFVSYPAAEGELVQKCYPEQPYIAPIIGTPSIPAQFVIDHNLGWNSGAVSVQALEGNGAFIAYPTPSVGVIFGLAPLSETPGQGYNLMDYAFHIEQGTYRVMENGEAKTGFVSYTAGDKFAITRINNEITYYVNNVAVYTSLTAVTTSLLYADISMYAAGDQLDDAAMVSLTDPAMEAVATGVATATARMASTTGGTADAAGGSTAFISVGSTHTMSAVASGKGTASVTGITVGFDLDGEGDGAASATANMDVRGPSGATVSLSEMLTIASEAAYAGGDAEMAGMTSTADDGVLTPKYSLSDTNFVPLNGVGTGLSGEVSVSSNMVLREFDTIAADHPYGESETTMPYLMSFGGEEVIYDGLVEPIPTMTMVGSGYVEAKNGMALFAPTLTLEAYGSGALSKTVPTMTLEASATMENYGSMTGVIPKATLEANGYLGSVGKLNGTAPSMTLEAISGSGMAKVLDFTFTLEASGTLENMGGLEAETPGLTLLSSGTIENVGTLEGELPSISMVMSAVSSLVIPTLTLNASAVQGTSYTSRCLSVNMSTGRVGELTNFDFHAIGLLGTDQILFTQAGSFVYGGVNDDGTQLDASVTMAATDFRSPRLKRMPYAYVYGRGDGALNVAQVTADGQETAQVSDNQYHVGAGNRRAQLSRKTLARYLGLFLESPGEPMFVEGIEMIIQRTERRR